MRGGSAPGNIELLDGAFELLRRVPAYGWLWWASGALPYALALLFFLSEMSGSAEAVTKLTSRSLVAAAAFIWLGCTQSIFCASLRQELSAEPTSLPSVLPVLRAQALVQATAVLILPLAFVSIIAVPWAIAFYQSAAAFPYRIGPVRARDVARYGAREASRWPLANLMALLTTAPLTLVIFVNTAVLLFAGPLLFRTFTGQESDFTRSPISMVNLIVVSAAFVVTWLCIDPVLKAIYTIRCFRADSLRTGDDLLASLKVLTRRAASVVLAVVLFATATVRLYARQHAVDPEQLERTIREVTRRPEYVWRSPRIVTPDVKNPFVRFSEDAMRWIMDVVASVVMWIGRIIESILKAILGSGISNSRGDGSVTPASIEALMIGLLVIVGGAVAYFVLQRSRTRRAVAGALEVPGPDAIDITSDDVRPDQLPDSDWLALAESWVARGDLRMATRAIFLGLLASLGSLRVISIDKGKSNLDYLRELTRRTRGNSVLHDGFGGCVRVFERTWYGGHDMSRDLFDCFRAEALNTRSCAQQT